MEPFSVRRTLPEKEMFFFFFRKFRDDLDPDSWSGQLHQSRSISVTQMLTQVVVSELFPFVRQFQTGGGGNSI